MSLVELRRKMKPCPPRNEKVYLVKILFLVIDRIFQWYAQFNFSVPSHVWIHIDLTAGGHALYKKRERERERILCRNWALHHRQSRVVTAFIPLFIFPLYSVLKQFAMTNHRCRAHASPTLTAQFDVGLCFPSRNYSSMFEVYKINT